MHLQENDIFDGRYRMLKRIGQGGFSEIWLAEDTKTDVEIALKIYAPGSGLDEDGINLFKEEFKRVFDLANPYLLRPMTFDIYDRTPYLVMSYCSHGSVSKYRKKLSEKDMWRFMRDVSSGLAYLHSLEPPIVHQDIKPENILISGKGDFLITDFGISTEIRSTLRRSTLVSSGGTIAYMAPERFSSKPSPVKASDVWSLGATMFELMTGDVPFGEHGGLIQYGGAALPELEGEYSKELKNYVLACLQKNPWDRPSAAELYRVAQSKLDGEKISTTHKKKEVPVLWKRPAVWISTAVIALLLGLGIYTTLGGRDTISEVQDRQTASSVNIYFADAKFKAYCVDNFDTNHDGEISRTEAANVTKIDISDMNITSLQEIGFFTALTELSCNWNELIQLDVSMNKALTNLYCGHNELRQLDVSKNMALTDLYCYENQLIQLDVSENTALTNLWCYENKLTQLDVSKNTALTELSCGNNELTLLDVSRNTVLTGLYCFVNSLTHLDVSKNKALTSLQCDNNRLTQLDVSKNTALTGLSCENNELTQLDVSKNTELTYLFCGANELMQLDVSKNTALNDLRCWNNKLMQLDLSKNTALKDLRCWNNELTQLDVSRNTLLTYLSCSGNQLTQLDVSKNTALEGVLCTNNQLTQLDVSQNMVLKTLYCQDNINLMKLYFKTGQKIGDLRKDTQTQIIYK